MCLNFSEDKVAIEIEISDKYYFQHGTFGFFQDLISASSD